MGLQSDFSNPWTADEEQFGTITGTFNVTRLPNIQGKLFRFKARSGNTGSIFLGNVSNTGSAPLLPLEMVASDDTGWFPADSLDRYYMAGSSGSCYLTYWIFG